MVNFNLFWLILKAFLELSIRPVYMRKNKQKSSMTIRIISEASNLTFNSVKFNLFWSISINFNLLWSISIWSWASDSICFGRFRSNSICFGQFQSVMNDLNLKLSFRFNLFWSISICFGQFWRPFWNWVFVVSIYGKVKKRSPWLYV